MTAFRVAYSIVILALALLVVFFEGTEIGYKMGYSTARSEDILSGKVVIEFKGGPGSCVNRNRGTHE